jgi:hypothetical protein
MLRIILTAALFLFLSVNIIAQDLSGTWEGRGGGTTVRIVLVKCGDKYLGYSYDKDGLGFCKTNIEATFDATNNKLRVLSKSFIDHSFGHSQTNYNLNYRPGTGTEEILRGTAHAKGAVLAVLSLGLGIPVTLRKISGSADTTAFISKALAAIIPKQQPALTTAVDTTTISPVLVNADTVHKLQLLRTAETREQVIIRTISTSEKKIVIKLYDNGVADGDSISIIHNATVIASRSPVHLEPFTFEINIDDTSIQHQVILVAHNLGRIPPNTATIEITAGTKKYIIPASSDLSRNAVIRFVWE